jgi:hypothetical protein
MAVIILDVCPRCKTDVSRRFGLITTPTIVCRNCGYEMRVTRNAILNNWAFNLCVGAILFAWGVLALAVLCSPEAAAAVGGGFKKPVRSGADRLMVALLAGLPALLAAVPGVLVGRLLGWCVAERLLSGSAPNPPKADAGLRLGRRELMTDALVPTIPGEAPRYDAPPTPPGGGVGRFLLRTFAGLLWFFAFFVIGCVAISAVATAGIAEEQARQKATEEAGKAWSLTVFFGSIALSVVLGKLGFLPGMRRPKAT